VPVTFCVCAILCQHLELLYAGYIPIARHTKHRFLALCIACCRPAAGLVTGSVQSCQNAFLPVEFLLLQFALSYTSWCPLSDQMLCLTRSKVCWPVREPPDFALTRVSHLLRMCHTMSAPGNYCMLATFPLRAIQSIRQKKQTKQTNRQVSCIMHCMLRVCINRTQKKCSVFVLGQKYFLFSAICWANARQQWLGHCPAVACCYAASSLAFSPPQTIIIHNTQYHGFLPNPPPDKNNTPWDMPTPPPPCCGNEKKPLILAAFLGRTGFRAPCCNYAASALCHTTMPPDISLGTWHHADVHLPARSPPLPCIPSDTPLCSLNCTGAACSYQDIGVVQPS
jgi:hypothetical protein